MIGKRKRRAPMEPIAGGERGRDRGVSLLPLMNVAFLLLVFFLLLCALRIGDTVTVLPNRTGAQASRDQPPVTLQVDASGGLSFQGKAMPAEDAIAAVRSALAAAPRSALDIKADRTTPASTLLPLLQKLQESGIASIHVTPVARGGPA